MIDANGREWEVHTEVFDCGRRRGVAIQSREPIGIKVRRLAVRTSPVLSEQEAIDEVMPILREWADSEAWDTRK